MADVVRLPFSLSSSLLLITSFSSKLNFLPLNPNCLYNKRICPVVCSTSGGVSWLPFSPRKQSLSFKLHATVAETDQPKWWEKNTPNMIDIHSTEEFLSALSQAGDRLVIVEFYGTWCASCRALFPKLCRTAVDHPEILFLKVNFDENKPMCKSLNVKVLPYFHFYRGADGQLESFSCSLAKVSSFEPPFGKQLMDFGRCMFSLSVLNTRNKEPSHLWFQKIKDAIELHNTARCSIGPPKGVGELSLESITAPKEKSP